MHIKDDLTNIPTPINFKGHTCVELFDANTGECILRQEDDNTYNARLQAYGYYLLFFANRGSSGTANLPYTGTVVSATNTNDTSQYPAVNSIPLFQRTGALNSFVTGNFSNFFNSMVLTTNTTAQSSTGRPSGYLVGWADTRTYAAVYNDYYEQGVLNLNESYTNGTNIHLVVDFDEYHGNTSFDAIWLYPGNTAASCGAHHSYRYFGYESTGNVIPQLNTNCHGIVDLDGRRRMFCYSALATGPGRGTNFAILDTYTGTWEGSYSFPAPITFGTCVYYDATNKIVYGMVDGVNNTAAGISKSTWWTTTTAENTRPYIVATDLENQTQTEIIDLRAFINKTPDDFGFVGASNNSLNWCIGYSETSTYLFLQAMGWTSANSTSMRIDLLVYRFNTNTLDFSYVGTISDLGVSVFLTTLSATYRPTNRATAMLRNTLVIGGGLYSNTNSNTNLATYIDLSNLSIITDSGVNGTGTGLTNGGLFSNYGRQESANIFNASSNAYPGCVMNGRRGWLDYDGPIYCDTHPPDGSYFTSLGAAATFSPVGVELRKYYYSDSFWTTHNKLSAPITKTQANTMRITYDITLDSLSDTMWMNLK